MSLFIITEKGTKKQFGVYHVRLEENRTMHDVTGRPWIDTYFLIYRKEQWEWVSAREFEPLDLDGIFNE